MLAGWWWLAARLLLPACHPPLLFHTTTSSIKSCAVPAALQPPCWPGARHHQAARLGVVGEPVQEAGELLLALSQLHAPRGVPMKQGPRAVVPSSPC